jgi:hypothetical protein
MIHNSSSKHVHTSEGFQRRMDHGGSGKKIKNTVVITIRD